MYFQLRKGKVTKTIPMGNDRFIDVDKAGKIIGIEVLVPTNIPEVDEAIAKSVDVIDLEQ